MDDNEGYIIEDTGMTILEDEDPNRRYQPDPKQCAPNRPDESILEWFDKAVESELEKHRTRTDLAGLALSQGVGHPTVLEGTATGIEILNELTPSPDTELSEAVEKLAMAEAIVAFEGAVRAAEEAASNAPPERAEEAAAAGARGYKAELTGVVRNQVPGDRPIEVIGYVGITRPKYPMQSKKP